MFDIFATILSAGVVISVVTLVVHEPLLLAAGISTILGLMFLLLPMFVAMVPGLGYILMFIGVVALGYGVVSTRSWLITLDARRVAARARKRALHDSRNRDQGGDSERKRVGAPLGVAVMAAPVGRGADDDSFDDAPTRAFVGRGEPPRGEGKANGAGHSAVARLGRGLGRAAKRSAPPEVRDDEAPVPRATGKPWRNPYERSHDHQEEGEARETTEVSETKDSARAEERSPAPPSVSQPLPTPTPAVTVASPARSPVPRSRGAERIQRIKAESRPAAAPRRRGAASEAPSVQSAAPMAGEPVAVAVVVPVAPPTPESQDSSARKQRRQRDLIELGLIDFEAEREVEGEAAETPTRRTGKGPAKPEAKPEAKPFVFRLARRG